MPPALRRRLASASGQVAAQRESLARATAALDRAIDVLLPREAAGAVLELGPPTAAAFEAARSRPEPTRSSSTRRLRPTPAARVQQILGHPHARLDAAVVAGQQSASGIAEAAVERARRPLGEARLEVDLPDAGDPRRGFEPGDQSAADAARGHARAHREQQQVRLVVAVLHDAEADAVGVAHRERDVGVAMAHARAHALGVQLQPSPCSIRSRDISAMPARRRRSRSG